MKNKVGEKKTFSDTNCLIKEKETDVEYKKTKQNRKSTTGEVKGEPRMTTVHQIQIAIKSHWSRMTQRVQRLRVVITLPPDVVPSLGPDETTGGCSSIKPESKPKKGKT